MLSVLHASTAERHWASGSCIRIETTPPSPARARDDRTQDLKVKAVAVVDDGAVQGRLTITPSRGTFTPSKLSLPGTLKAVVPSGAKAARADLELRSKRGIGRRTIEVLARADVLWYLELTHVAKTVLPDDVGNGEGEASFFLDIRVDPSAASGAGTKANPATAPLVFERTSFIWSGKAHALGVSRPFSGSLSELSTLDYSNPLWMLQLPSTDFMAADGWLDLTNRKLYLFIAAAGDDSGTGTFNLGPKTDCTFHRAKRTYKVYLVFDVAEDWTIRPGYCEDKIPYESSSGNGILTRGIRTWTWDLESDMRTYAAGG
jgi:hypothetical protein